MGNAQPVGDAPRVVDILPGAATARATDRPTVVVELQGDADHLVAGFGEQGCGDRAVDAARHGDDHAGRGGTIECERVHARNIEPRARNAQPHRERFEQAIA